MGVPIHNKAGKDIAAHKRGERMIKAKRKFLGEKRALQNTAGRVKGERATSKGVLPKAA